MSEHKGWFKLNRKLFDSWLWKDKPFAKGQAWVDLIGLANHSDVELEKNGKVIKGKRGEVNRSLRFLADRWGWSVGKVKRFLSVLEAEQMVTQRVYFSEQETEQDVNSKQNTKETVITIEKYDVYQAIYDSNGTQMEQQTEHIAEHPRNTDGTPTEHPRNTNKELKNVKNYKNDKNNYYYNSARAREGQQQSPSLSHELRGLTRTPEEQREFEERYEAYMDKLRRPDLGGKTVLEFMQGDD